MRSDSTTEGPGGEPGSSGVRPQAPASAQTTDFLRVYRTHVGFVFRLMRRFGVGAAELEDATQEVFMIVHRRLGEFDRSRGTVKSWLFALTRGIAANRRRKNERRLRLVPPSPAVAPDRGPNPEQRTGDRQVLALVDKFLSTLSDPQREVFELSEIEGLRGPEIAEVLSVKLNTVYTRLRAARQAFAQYAARLGPDLGGAHV